MTLLSKDKLESIKLKQEETVHLNTFIGTSVRSNFSYTLLTDRAGVSPAMNIQEIYNQNVATLSKYGMLLTAEQNKRGSADFDALNTGNTAFMTPGNNLVPASDMLDVLKLIIREKTYFSEVGKRTAVLKELNKELENMATPEEKKQSLIREIATLQAQQ